jgi:hypothetical protein
LSQCVDRASGATFPPLPPGPESIRYPATANNSYVNACTGPDHIDRICSEKLGDWFWMMHAGVDEYFTFATCTCTKLLVWLELKPLHV